VTFEFRVREELKEVEALLRLAVDARTDPPDRFEPALRNVTALVRGIHLAAPPNPRN
jgi:hypothetical protein